MPRARNNRAPRSRDKWIAIIALFKLLKAVLLIAAGIGVLKLLHRDVAQVAERWIYFLQLDPNNDHVQGLLTKIWSLDDRRLKELSAGTFAYAALFLTEGVGLWRQKRWAHYFTIIVTASFLPIEGYELVQEPSIAKVGVTVVNVAIVIYLIIRLRQK